MPLVELKTFQPVCDQCGTIGSMWMQLPESEREKAIPEGWNASGGGRYRVHTYMASSDWIEHSVVLTCKDCQSGVDRKGEAGP